MPSAKKIATPRNKDLKSQEKKLEKKLKLEVEKKGGLALKFTSPYFTGMPDRMVLIPGGLIFFVELKTTGKKLSPRQVFVTRMLKKLGFEVFIVSNQESLNDFLERLR